MTLSYLGIALQADDSAVYLLKLVDRLETTPVGYTSVDIRTLVTLSAQDGTLLWSVNDPEPGSPDISGGASLMLCDHTLYLMGLYHMSMFNAQDGKVLGSYRSSLNLWLFESADHFYGRTLAGGFCSLRSRYGTKRWCANISPIMAAAIGTENVYLFGHPNKAAQAVYYLRNAPFLSRFLVLFLKNDPQNAIYVLKQKNGRRVRRYLPDDPAQVSLYSMTFGDV